MGGAAWSGEADAASGASAVNSVALVTRVSRRGGIGFAIARRLAEAGFDLVIQHWVPHDVGQPWGSDDIDLVVSELRSCLAPGRRLVHVSADFSQPDAPEAVVDAGMREFGHVDVLVANHAMSGSDGSLDSITAADLDHHWAVNTRSSIMLAAAVAQVRDPRVPGRIEGRAGGHHEDDCIRAGPARVYGKLREPGAGGFGFVCNRRYAGGACAPVPVRSVGFA